MYMYVMYYMYYMCTHMYVYNQTHCTYGILVVYRYRTQFLFLVKTLVRSFYYSPFCCATYSMINVKPCCTTQSVPFYIYGTNTCTVDGTHRSATILQQ